MHHPVQVSYAAIVISLCKTKAQNDGKCRSKNRLSRSVGVIEKVSGSFTTNKRHIHKRSAAAHVKTHMHTYSEVRTKRKSEKGREERYKPQAHETRKREWVRERERDWYCETYALHVWKPMKGPEIVVNIMQPAPNAWKNVHRTHNNILKHTHREIEGERTREVEREKDGQKEREINRRAQTQKEKNM